MRESDSYVMPLQIRSGSNLTRRSETSDAAIVSNKVKTQVLLYVTRARVLNDPEEARRVRRTSCEKRQPNQLMSRRGLVLREQAAQPVRG